MKILWFTWKDRVHPLAGGAETVNEELARRLVAHGHEVIFLVGGFPGGPAEETRNGFKIIRLGSRYSVYYQAYQYYKKNLVGWADLAIDEVNTIPFFCKFYVKEKNLLFVHQLCREIWFYQMAWPLSLIGYLLEPLYLWLLRGREVITVSPSTKQDLLRFGFRADHIQIISEGIELEPVSNLVTIKKYEEPTILALGSIRAMKRTSQIITAFSRVQAQLPTVRLIVAGQAEGKYGQKILRMIKESPAAQSIEYRGAVNPGQKLELLQQSHLIAATSVKEGWGLIVTEAASQGTPAVVYDVDGLRDAVKNRVTGIVCQHNTPAELAANLVGILQDTNKYQQLQAAALDFSRTVNFDRSYQDFIQAVTT
jgi:glycosyltransferase involved in cell wall biosynthesis